MSPLAAVQNAVNNTSAIRQVLISSRSRAPSDWHRICVKSDMAERAEGVLETIQEQSRHWTFLKGGDELTVEHIVHGDRVSVTVRHDREVGGETARVHDFPTQSAADEFQANLDASLLKFGWVFIGYLPNRRRPADRPEHLAQEDRRRWWTDGGTFLDTRA